MELSSNAIQGLGLIIAVIGQIAAAVRLGAVFRALPSESPATFERIGSPKQFNDAALKLIAFQFSLLGREVIVPPSITAQRYRASIRLSALAVVFGSLVWLTSTLLSAI